MIAIRALHSRFTIGSRAGSSISGGVATSLVFGLQIFGTSWTEISIRDLSADIVRRYLWALRSFFDFLCLEGIVDAVAPRLVRPRPLQQTLPRALSKENAIRLIEATSNVRDRALLELFYATGCRISELVGARVEHVDFAKRRIWIYGKGKARRVFFGPAALKYLRRYLSGPLLDFFSRANTSSRKDAFPSTAHVGGILEGLLKTQHAAKPMLITRSQVHR